MSDIAVQVENLGKQYRLRTKEQASTNLRESILSAIASPFRYLREVTRPPTAEETLWAIRNVSFEVKRGEVMGIIGHNGAGKSTLLKILSRITEPTEGHAKLNGRLGTILEVGTGFHPELSGRENIYMSGAILGMRKAEIDLKLDEIVDFAGIDKFLDTPAKRYSSGMYVRLAFAVAAHLEPEILIIDEVLAVGDAEFQRKCLGRMETVANEGRTVLFVSHNMQAVARLCSHLILLNHGSVTYAGETARGVSNYLYEGHDSTAEKRWPISTAPGNDVVRLLAVRARTEAGTASEVFDIRNPILIDLEYEILQPTKSVVANIDVTDGDGHMLFASVDQYNEDYINRPPGRYLSTCVIPGNLLAEGAIFIRAGVVGLEVPIQKHVVVRDAIAFQVIDTMEGDSARGRIAHSYPGLIRPKLEWRVQNLPALHDQIVSDLVDAR